MLGVLGAYASYGSDRVTGALELVLARSITRRGLAATRYASAMFALGSALICSLLVDELLIYMLTGKLFAAADLGLIMPTLLAGLAAFVGIVFIISQFVRSTGALIGISMALILVFDLFWSIIVLLIAGVSSSSYGSVGFLRAFVAAYFLNPAQLSNLAAILLTGNLQYALVTPAAYGVSWLTIGLASTAWWVVPFLLFIVLSKRRD